VVQPNFHGTDGFNSESHGWYRKTKKRKWGVTGHERKKPAARTWRKKMGGEGKVQRVSWIGTGKKRKTKQKNKRGYCSTGGLKTEVCKVCAAWVKGGLGGKVAHRVGGGVLCGAQEKKLRKGV